MRKILLFIFTLLMFIPINVYAETYTLKDLDLSIDDSEFEVFTRDNIKDNERLTELGVTYSYLSSFMTSNNVYLDAIKFADDDNDTIELFVVAKSVNNVSNMHTYSDSDIKEVGEELKEKVKTDSYKVITVGKYKYIYLNYYDSSKGYYIDEYYTVMNGYGYSILAQKTSKFTDDEMKGIKSIINTSKYKYVAKYEKNNSNGIGLKTLIGAIIGAVVGLVGGITKVVKNKKQKQKEKSE